MVQQPGRPGVLRREKDVEIALAETECRSPLEEEDAAAETVVEDVERVVEDAAAGGNVVLGGVMLDVWDDALGVLGAVAKG